MDEKITVGLQIVQNLFMNQIVKTCHPCESDMYICDEIYCYKPRGGNPNKVCVCLLVTLVSSAVHFLVKFVLLRCCCYVDCDSICRDRPGYFNTFKQHWIVTVLFSAWRVFNKGCIGCDRAILALDFTRTPSQSY